MKKMLYIVVSVTLVLTSSSAVAGGKCMGQYSFHIKPEEATNTHHKVRSPRGEAYSAKSCENLCKKDRTRIAQLRKGDYRELSYTCFYNDRMIIQIDSRK